MSQSVEITVEDEAGLMRPYTSMETSIVKGTVQGSILGLTLFLLSRTIYPFQHKFFYVNYRNGLSSPGLDASPVETSFAGSTF